MFLLFRVRRCFYSETSLAGSRVVVTGNEAVSFRKSVGGKKKKLSFLYQASPVHSQTYTGAAAIYSQWTLGLQHLRCGLSIDSTPRVSKRWAGPEPEPGPDGRTQPSAAFCDTGGLPACVCVCESGNWHAVCRGRLMCITLPCCL